MSEKVKAALVHARELMDCWAYNPKTSGCRPGAICPPCLSVIEIAEALASIARPNKRHADWHGCPERSGHNCLGVRLHCRLEAGHQPLGHDFAGDLDVCSYGWTLPDIDPGCGHTRAIHGTPHAMEVSGPYVLSVEGGEPSA